MRNQLHFFSFLTATALCAWSVQAAHTKDHHCKKHHTAKIADRYESYEGLQKGLRDAGLSSSNLMIAIDFTGSNKKQGKHTYAKNMSGEEQKAFSNLHWVHPQWPNPYQQAITIISRTLAPFDADQKYPVFGFGDTNTQDKSVFDISLGEGYCTGVEQVMQAYKAILPSIKMDGPTSFAPAIEKALNIVHASNGSYHLLIIITDGFITEDLESLNKAVLAKASLFPLSIIIVGVGDGDGHGKFDQMSKLDDDVDQRLFDNVQFVQLSKIMSENAQDVQTMELDFAVKALMEVPAQFKIMQDLGMFKDGYNDKKLTKALKWDMSKASDRKKISSAIHKIKHEHKH
jgi:E3 ubiquitin-protein ligase RGLG